MWLVVEEKAFLPPSLLLTSIPAPSIPAPFLQFPPSTPFISSYTIPSILPSSIPTSSFPPSPHPSPVFLTSVQLYLPSLPSSFHLHALSFLPFLSISPVLLFPPLLSLIASPPTLLQSPPHASFRLYPISALPFLAVTQSLLPSSVCSPSCPHAFRSLPPTRREVVVEGLRGVSREK